MFSPWMIATRTIPQNGQWYPSARNGQAPGVLGQEPARSFVISEA
jgi:hypothetical protein